MLSKGDVSGYGSTADWQGEIDEDFRSDRGSGDPEGGRESFLSALQVDRHASKSPSRGAAQTYRTRVRTGVDVDTRDKLVDRIKAVCWGEAFSESSFLSKNVQK